VPRRAKFLGTVLAGSKNYSRIPIQTDNARIVPAGRRRKLGEYPNP